MLSYASIFDRNEHNTHRVWEKLQSLLVEHGGFIQQLLQIPNFNDEPQYFHYSALVKKSTAHPAFNSAGCARTSEKAQIKVLGEVVERYCQHVFQPQNGIRAPYQKLNGNAINPRDFVSFSPSQFRSGLFQAFTVSPRDTFLWMSGASLIDGKVKWVPFQLVSINYNLKHEKIIRIPITNGAALGSSLSDSACRAIWECIERDAFLITYLNKLPRAKITIDDPEIAGIIDYFARYKLEVHCFDITSDIPIPTIMVMIIDRTGVGPVLTVGLKCSMNAKDAVIGAIEEANQFRPFIRKEILTKKMTVRREDLYKLEHKVRVLYWNRLSRLKYLHFLLNTNKEIPLQEIPTAPRDALANLKRTVVLLQERALETVLVDCTISAVKAIDLHVVKAIMPSLQPFYLSERYKYLGGERLYTVPHLIGFTDKNTMRSHLNAIPHPF